MTNVLFITYLLFVNSMSPGVFNIILITIFSVIFIKQSILPIKARIVTEEELSNVVEIHNLRKIIKIINTSSIDSKIHTSQIFDLVVMGIYKPNYMLKVFSYLISKDILLLDDQGFIVNKHVGFFTKGLLHLGIVPLHNKVEINIF